LATGRRCGPTGANSAVLRLSADFSPLFGRKNPLFHRAAEFFFKLLIFLGNYSQLAAS
jgi:hypothetical protein